MTDEDTTVIARTVARIVFPLIVLTAIALLVQGHNRPGGGFIAGVLTAVAVALMYVIYGPNYFADKLFADGVPFVAAGDRGIDREFVNVLAVGLAIAAGGGVGAILLGEPFLTQAVFFFEHVPLFGHAEFATAFVFDLGVFLVVVAGLLTILAVVGAE